MAKLQPERFCEQKSQRWTNFQHVVWHHKATHHPALSEAKPAIGKTFENPKVLKCGQKQTTKLVKWHLWAWQLRSSEFLTISRNKRCLVLVCRWHRLCFWSLWWDTAETCFAVPDVLIPRPTITHSLNRTQSSINQTITMRRRWLRW